MGRRLRGLVFSILLLLTACAPSGLNLDSGLFSGKPCKVPCWNNLLPGKSTAADVDHFVSSLSANDWPVQRLITEAANCHDLQIRDKPGLVVDAAVTFTIDREVLTLIESSPYYPITLQDVAGHLGPPEYYEAIQAIGPDGQAYIVTVYYPSQGLAFRVAVDESQVGLVRENMHILTVQYFAAGDMLSYFTNKYSCIMSQADAFAGAQQEISTFVQPWSGFGKVKVIESR